MAQMKPDTLRQKIDEAKAELVLMDEIESMVRLLKFKDSLFAHRMWAECKTERPKTAARIERWQRMLAARDSRTALPGFEPGNARAAALAARAERDSRTTLPDDETSTRVRYDVRDV